MIFVALVLVAALAGCGGDTTQDTSTTISTTSTSPASCTSALPADPAPPGDEIFIEIEAPRDGQVFKDRLVRFEGTTQPGATVTAGQFQDVSEDGTWCFDLLLNSEPGAPLTARFTAEDAAGNQETDTVRVIYDPPVVTTTSEPSL
jgi:hypothetical protein